MKKLSSILSVPLLCLSIFLSLNVSTANAESAPTCSISFTPQTVKVGESSTETFTYTGVITDTEERSMDQDFPVGQWVKSYAVSIVKGYSREMWATEIGYRTHEFRVTGPGGTGNCSATLKIIPNTDWNSNNTIEFKNSVFFTVAGRLASMKDCPVSTCFERIGVKDIPDGGKVLINKKNGNWYYALYSNIGGGSFEGWIPSNVVPVETLQKIASQNPSISVGQLTSNYTDED